MAEMSALELASVCLVAGTGFMLLWRLVWSGVRADQIRNSYCDARLPIMLRTSVAVLPFFGAATFAAALLFVLPRPYAAWLSIPIVAATLTGFVLVYRTPLRLLPPWLRKEIEAGITPLARPDWGDGLLFAIVVPLLTLGVLGLPFFIVAYGLAGP